MIYVCVVIALCGVVSGDVSDIINPVRQYLPPKGYLPPAIPKLRETSTFAAEITTPFQEYVQYSSTPLPIVLQDLAVQTTVVPEISKTVAPDVYENLIEKELVTASDVTVPPVSTAASVQRQYLPPLTSAIITSQVVEDASTNSDLLSLPLAATPNDVEISLNSNPEDLQLLTTTLSQPNLSTIGIPQTTSIITSTTGEPTTIAPQGLVSLVSEANQDLITSTIQPTSIPDYIQRTAEQTTAKSDSLIRINASELSEAADQIGELPSSQIEISTPGTILSEDGYHYSIPVVSFGLLNKQ